MSLKTAFLNLFKPEVGDRFSITGTEGYNKNMDLIDAAVKKNAGDIAQLNSEFAFESVVRNIANSNYQYFVKSGYILIAVTNGDFNTCNTKIKSVSRQGETDIVFLEESVNGFYRFNILWVKQ